MKINYFLFLISLTVTLISCSENEILEPSIDDSNLLTDELSDYLSDFEIVKINVPALYHAVKNQTSDIKELSLLDGRLKFAVENTNIEMNNHFNSLEADVLIENHEHNETLYLDNLGLIGPASDIVGMTLRESDLYIEYSEQGEEYFIAPVKDIIQKSALDTYVLYSKKSIKDIQDEGSDCLLIPQENQNLNPNSPIERVESRMAQYNVSVTVVIDYSMQQYLGRSGAIQYVNDAMYWTNFRFNAWSGLPISIIKGAGYILDQPGQYGLSYSSSPTTYLNNYASWLNRYNIGNDAEILFTRDHAHWGAAYMNTICGYNANALVEYHSWNTRRYNIIAHELGHILGAGHTNDGVMRTVANGSSTFTSYSKGQILSFLGFTNWCL